MPVVGGWLRGVLASMQIWVEQARAGASKAWQGATSRSLLFLTNIIFGNYRLPIKIYYICSYTVDEKKCPAVGTVFLVAVGRLLCVGKGDLISE